MNSTVEEISFEICENADAEQLLPIEEGLNDFNDLMTGISDRKPLSVLLKSTKTGEVLGGMQGRFSLGLLFLSTTRAAENGAWHRYPKSLRG